MRTGPRTSRSRHVPRGAVFWSARIRDFSRVTAPAGSHRRGRRPRFVAPGNSFVVGPVCGRVFTASRTSVSGQKNVTERQLLCCNSSQFVIKCSDQAALGRGSEAKSSEPPLTLRRRHGRQRIRTTRGRSSSRYSVIQSFPILGRSEACVRPPVSFSFLVRVAGAPRAQSRRAQSRHYVAVFDRQGIP